MSLHTNGVAANGTTHQASDTEVTPAKAKRRSFTPKQKKKTPSIDTATALPSPLMVYDLRQETVAQNRVRKSVGGVEKVYDFIFLTKKEGLLRAARSPELESPVDVPA